jgi:hypothetical protein
MQGAWKMTLPPAAQADWITADFEQEMQACRRGLAWGCHVPLYTSDALTDD